MNRCGYNDGLSEPFVTAVMDRLPVTGWSGRRMAAMQLEALRKHCDFYGRYGGFLDVLEAIALFGNFGPQPQSTGAQIRASRWLLEAGWRRETINLVKGGMDVLLTDDGMYNGLSGDARNLRGGLMVLRDVWLVPQFITGTREHAERLVLDELEEDLKAADPDGPDPRAKAWEMRQDWLKAVREKLRGGVWRSLGWSCAYEQELEKYDELALVSDLIHKDVRAVAPSKSAGTA